MSARAGRRRRVRRAVGPAVASVLVVGVLFLAVFPTRTYLSQRASTQAAREKVTVLQQQNAALEQRANELHQDAEIERLAREQYNLVRPGEEAYAVLPPPAPPTTVPAEGDAGGTSEADDDDRNILERAWHAIF